MSHPDEEELVAVATGLDPSAQAVLHLQACGPCGTVVNEYRNILTLLADDDGLPVALEEPPALLWPQIESALAAQEAGLAEPLPQPVELPRASPPPEPGPSQQRDSGRAGGSARLWLAAAAVAGLGVGLLGGYALWRTDEVSNSPGTPIASAELDTLDAPVARGNATVVRTGQSIDLTVTTEPFDPGKGYLEVWLINRDGTRMISVGVLDSGTQQAAFPISQDLLDQGYVIVDISREGFDANPLHSGDSLVRGELKT